MPCYLRHCTIYQILISYQVHTKIDAIVRLINELDTLNHALNMKSPHHYSQTHLLYYVFDGFEIPRWGRKVNRDRINGGLIGTLLKA